MLGEGLDGWVVKSNCGRNGTSQGGTQPVGQLAGYERIHAQFEESLERRQHLSRSESENLSDQATNVTVNDLPAFAGRSPLQFVQQFPSLAINGTERRCQPIQE